MRRLWPLTRSAVSARSSGVDSGIWHAVDLLTDVDGDDVGALLRQPHRVRAALAARRAGDESDLAFNTSSHVLTSIRR